MVTAHADALAVLRVHAPQRGFSFTGVTITACRQSWQQDAHAKLGRHNGTSRHLSRNGKLAVSASAEATSLVWSLD